MDLEIEWEDEVDTEETPFTVIPIPYLDTDMITKKVLSMKKDWVNRSEEFPFYTLGRCAYLDGKTDAYYKDLINQNNILVKEFDRLYLSIGNKLKDLLKEDIYLSHTLRVPGFHIFPSHPKFLSIAGKWHQDYPHTTLGLEEMDSYAFTLVIKLPASGGGMDYIDEFHQPQHFAYNEKDLVIHNGKTIHRIAGIKKYVSGEYRITLQGHIIRRDGVLEIFF